MNLLQSFVRSTPKRSLSWPPSFSFDGSTYPLSMPRQTLGFKEERIDDSFTGLARGAYRSNGVVFACMEYRRRTFSQARLRWEELLDGSPSGRFSDTSALDMLAHPWTGGTTRDLLSRAIQHADLAGNAFIVRRGRRLTLLRPDWVTIVAASREEPDQGLAAIDADVVGYAYWPGGAMQTSKPEVLLPHEVAHFAPIPDPDASFRGISLLTSITREVMGDNAATTHKLKFFENGATPNMVVSLDPAITLDKFNAWVEAFDQKHEGVANAYKTMYLGGGADVEVVGADLKQLEFKVTQGAGETRIAAAAGVPPVLVGLSEGLASATYSNYASARRSYSDTTLWDLWGNIAGSLESILPPPPATRLWVDGRRIPFLQEDEKDRAEIQALDASAINQLVTAGYKPASVVDAVTSGDLTRLEHSGLYSVQLQAPGAELGEPSADTGRALIAQAEQRLLEAGTKPTVANIAEALEVSDRTVRRWRSE